MLRCALVGSNAIQSIALATLIYRKTKKRNCVIVQTEREWFKCAKIINFDAIVLTDGSIVSSFGVKEDVCHWVTLLTGPGKFTGAVIAATSDKDANKMLAEKVGALRFDENYFIEGGIDPEDIAKKVAEILRRLAREMV